MVEFNQELNEIQEVIAFYDTRGDGRVEVGQVGACLRSLGLTPTEAQLAILTQQWSDKETRLTIEEFTPIFRELKKDKTFVKSPEELAECLANFDREGNGLVTLHDMRYLLTNCGEKLSESDVEILLRGQANSEGKLNIHEFIRLITDVSFRRSGYGSVSLTSHNSFD